MAQEVIKCSYCKNQAKYETVVSGVYLCENDYCWLQATQNEFIDGELEQENNNGEILNEVPYAKEKECDHPYHLIQGYTCLGCGKILEK